MNVNRNSESEAPTGDPPLLQSSTGASSQQLKYCPRSIMKLKLERTSSDASGLKKAIHKTTFMFPEKSALKQFSGIASCEKTSRTRSVSFSNLLLEEIVDDTEMREDSDSEYEDALTDLDDQDCERMENKFVQATSSQHLSATHLEFRKSQSLESLNIRPPTPPNASHLVKPIMIENCVSSEN